MICNASKYTTYPIEASIKIGGCYTFTKPTFNQIGRNHAQRLEIYVGFDYMRRIRNKNFFV